MAKISGTVVDSALSKSIQPGQFGSKKENSAFVQSSQSGGSTAGWTMGRSLTVTSAGSPVPDTGDVGETGVHGAAGGVSRVILCNKQGKQLNKCRSNKMQQLLSKMGDISSQTLYYRP